MWIDSGHRYWFRPAGGRVWTFIVLIAIVGIMTFGASLLGLSTNPAPAGYAFLAGSLLISAAAITALVIYLRRAGLYVDSSSVGRINFFGRQSGGCRRGDVIAVAVHRGSYGRWVLDEPEENRLWLKLRNGGAAMQTSMYFYSVKQAQGLAAVLGVPFELV